MAVTAWFGALALLASAGPGAARSVPVLQAQPMLPPVPGYIPVFIQSGDSPPDVQRLYESHRTLAAHGSAPAPVHAAPPGLQGPPSRRAAPPPQAQEAVAAHSSEAVPSGPRPRPQSDAPPSPPRSRVTDRGAHREAAAPPPALAPVNSRITKKGGAGPAPAVAAASAASASVQKKRAGTRVQYQHQQQQLQQQRAAQTRKRQQQLRSAKQQPQPQQQR